MKKPRAPQQTRSRATVDAIVEAGFISLARHGLSGTTTRHIADIAGIGVGSLYEYFPNKEAVYAAMSQQFIAEIVLMIRQLTPQLVQTDLRSLVIGLLSQFSELLNRNEGRYLKYASYAMRSEQRKQLEPIQKLLGELVMQYVMHHPELMQLRNIPTMSYIVINGGLFTIIRYLAEPSPNISFEQLVQGLADMVASYAEAGLKKINHPPEMNIAGGSQATPAPVR